MVIVADRRLSYVSERGSKAIKAAGQKLVLVQSRCITFSARPPFRSQLRCIFNLHIKKSLKVNIVDWLIASALYCSRQWPSMDTVQLILLHNIYR